MPVSEVDYSWVDGDRSFLVLKRVPGIMLRDAWGTMSATERDKSWMRLFLFAIYLLLLLWIDSRMYIEVQCWSLTLLPRKWDSLEPLDVRESKIYFFREGLHLNPEIEEQFHLYHPDLGPENILVHNKKLSAIIDWECAGFYPRFWISTKPSVSPGLNFYPPIPGVDEIEWRKRLRIKLEESGYPRFAKWFLEWRRYQVQIVNDEVHSFREKLLKISLLFIDMTCWLSSDTFASSFSLLLSLDMSTYSLSNASLFNRLGAFLPRTFFALQPPR